MGGFVVLGAVVWVTCAWFAAVIAGNKGRRQWLWAILGILAGPFAMFAVYVMEPVRGAGSGGSGSGGSKHQDPREALYEVPRHKR